MSKKWGWIFPGQGAQYVGMMRDFYDAFSEAKETFEEADEILKTSLTKLIFEGPLQELTQTKNSQPAIFVASNAILRVMQNQFPDIKPSFCGGLSLGEYTALMASGKLSFAECLPIVALRGKYMQEACEKASSSMYVVLGQEADAIETTLATLRPKEKVWIANLNCQGQVVIAGTKSSLDVAKEVLLAKGAKRVLPLEVAGAFHTPLMQEAEDKLGPKLQLLKLKDSPCQVIMNAPGAIISNPSEIIKHLTRQVTSPVLWEKAVRSISSEVDTFLEIGPGKTLQGMNKRMGLTTPTFSIEKISDLDNLVKAQDGIHATAITG